MTKETMLKKVDSIISKLETIIKDSNKMILDCSDSPRVAERLGFLHEDSVRHLSGLQELKKTIEDYSEEKEQASKMFAGYNSYPLPEMIGGITFSEDKGDE